MNKTIRELYIPRFRNATRREEAISQQRLTYEQLAKMIGGFTTEVLVNELLESSPDPHMVRARRLYAYPPQSPVDAKIVTNTTEERVRGDRMMTEVTLRRQFRPDTIRGYMGLDYTEEVGPKQQGIGLSVYSINGKDEFPPEMLAKVEAVFEAAVSKSTPVTAE